MVFVQIPIVQVKLALAVRFLDPVAQVYMNYLFSAYNMVFMRKRRPRLLNNYYFYPVVKNEIKMADNLLAKDPHSLPLSRMAALCWLVNSKSVTSYFEHLDKLRCTSNSYESQEEQTLLLYFRGDLHFVNKKYSDALECYIECGKRGFCWAWGAILRTIERYEPPQFTFNLQELQELDDANEDNLIRRNGDFKYTNRRTRIDIVRKEEKIQSPMVYVHKGILLTRKYPDVANQCFRMLFNEGFDYLINVDKMEEISRLEKQVEEIVQMAGYSLEQVIDAYD